MTGSAGHGDARWRRVLVGAVRRRRRAELRGYEESRARLARELHDGILQELAQIRRMLEAAPAVRDPSRPHPSTVSALLAEQIDGLRRIVDDLHPTTLAHLGLRAALQTLAERRADGYPGVRITVDAPADDPQDPDLRLDVYRIVQEGLSNALRHGTPHRIRVAVRRQDGALVVTVADDGGGIVRGEHPGGHGLPGMRSRVAAHGGTLSVGDAPGGGTLLVARLPEHPAEWWRWRRLGGATPLRPRSAEAVPVPADVPGHGTAA